MNTSTATETQDKQPPIELAVLLQQEAMLRQDIRHSQWRTVFILLASTFLLFYWFSTLSQMRMEQLRFRGPFPMSSMWLPVPAIMNLLTWLFWGTEAYLSVIGFTIKPHRAPDAGTLQVREVLDAYQYSGFALRRQVRRERILAFLVAIQIMFMAVAIAWLLLSGSRDFGANY